MKKYIIAVLCACTALTSHAIKLELKRFHRPAKRLALQAWKRHPVPSSISVPHQPISWKQVDFKGLPENLHKQLATEMLDRTRAMRAILNEEGSLSWETRPSRHSADRGPGPLREEIFTEGMTLIDKLTAEMNFQGYEDPFMEIPDDLTKYFELSAQVAKLIERTDELAKFPREGAVKEEENKLYAQQHNLLREMQILLERLPNSAHGSFQYDLHEFLGIPDSYVSTRTRLTKFDGVANRLLAQNRRMEEENPSLLTTLNAQERIEHAKARTLQIIEFQEQLRDFIRNQMDQPWTSNMARLDFVLCVYKYYYSTLAGHPIPVPSYYYEKGLESNFEAGGLIQQIKPGWADKERALFQEQPAPFSRIPGYVSPVGIYPTEKTAAPQTTQVADLPRANPSFEGLSGEEFATLAEDILEGTKSSIEGYYEYAFHDILHVEEDLRDSYQNIYQQSWAVLKQMIEEIEPLIEKRTALSPVAAEVQLGKILETQTMLRTFAAKYLDKWSAPTILTLDYFLSQYRYLYATSADIFAAMPANIYRPYFSDNINNILNKLKTRYRNGNPMVSKKEVNHRRRSKQLEEDSKHNMEESEED